MRTDGIKMYLARHKSAARLLLIALFFICILMFLFFGGDYLLSLRRASLVILPGEAPLVRSLPNGEYGKIDINQATAAELESVSGIGPVTAQSILTLREERRGFYFMEELLDVPGIGEKRLEALRTVFYCAPPAENP